MIPGEPNAWGHREQAWASQQGFLSSKLVQLKLGQIQSYPRAPQRAPPALPSPAWSVPSTEAPTRVVIVQVTGKANTYTDSHAPPHTSRDQFSFGPTGTLCGPGLGAERPA
uniref:Uncharacterized protein n=1 Tax=Micrurus surinamensis TaxID=129470 RepID=A0A2D4NV84_MICSU